MSRLAIKIIKYSIGCAIALGLAWACSIYYQYRDIHPTTDDAYVEANVVHLAARLTDNVDHVYVTNQEHVKKGQLLFVLDPKPYQLALAQANDKLQRAKLQIKADSDSINQVKALVSQRQAELQNIKLDTVRKLTLAKRGFISASEADAAKKNLQVAIQNLNAAESQLSRAENIRGRSGKDNAAIHEAEIAVKQAKLNLHYTRVKAPADGYIANFSLRPGSKVNAYQEVLALVQDQGYWISANFKETQLANMHPGDKVAVSIDMYPKVKFVGAVTSISAGSGVSFSLLPPENATGNWIKVTQRFPVRINILNPNPKYPLRLGASASVTVTTKARG